MFDKILIANRGEIALRVIRACQAVGIETVAAVSAADRDSMAARIADRAVCIGPARSSDSYLRIDALLSTALGTGCDAVHPGYGFLSENARFAAACAENGLIFVGPSAENIRQMGNKLVAREIAHEVGVPIAPGSQRISEFSTARAMSKLRQCPSRGVGHWAGTTRTSAPSRKGTRKSSGKRRS